jgi:hypothetical protein
MLTEYLWEHMEITPTELREAAMLAAHRVDVMRPRQQFVFTREGLLQDPPDNKEEQSHGQEH